MKDNRELFCLLAEMTKATRCCQQDGILGSCMTFSQFYILDLVGKHAPCSCRNCMRCSKLKKAPLPD